MKDFMLKFTISGKGGIIHIHVFLKISSHIKPEMISVPKKDRDEKLRPRSDSLFDKNGTVY